MMTKRATTSDRIWALARRLGAQAILSATVMAGLHMASINGYDMRDLLPTDGADREAASPASAPPLQITGIPARYDLPVQAGGLLESLVRRKAAEDASREAAGPPAPIRAGETLVREAAVVPGAASPALKLRPAASDAADLAGMRPVAVPTPRPPVAATAAASTDPVPQPQATPEDLPFDTSPRGVEVYDIAELVDPPAPFSAGDGFQAEGLVPSGATLLHRTAEITGTAADVITGTASRIIDLVR